jgi:hypothetical protein
MQKLRHWQQQPTGMITFVCWRKRMVRRLVVSLPSSMKNKVETPKLN